MHTQHTNIWSHTHAHMCTHTHAQTVIHVHAYSYIVTYGIYVGLGGINNTFLRYTLRINTSVYLKYSLNIKV